MKRNRLRRGARRGSALLTVVIVVLISSAFVATLASVSVSRTFMTKKLAERIKAAAIAEAGAAEAYTVLAHDFSQRTNAAAFPQTAYAGGFYDVTVRAVASNEASVCSTGIYGSVTEVVMVDLKRGSSDESSETPASEAYGYAICAGGEISWTGASEFYGSKAHGNGKFTQSGSGYLHADVSSSTSFRSNGNSGGIDGDVSAPSMSGKLGNITGAKTVGEVPLVDIPDIDLTPYYNEALANGQVHNGNLALSSDFEPTGGILWINGDLSLAGNADFEGCFIATGDVSVSGGGSIGKVENYPTLVSRDGDIDFTGQKAVDGLIYVKMGDYKQAGGNNLTGQIIVRGDVDKSGSSTVISYSDSTPTAPGEEDGSTDEAVGVTAWQL